MRSVKLSNFLVEEYGVKGDAAKIFIMVLCVQQDEYEEGNEKHEKEMNCGGMIRCEVLIREECHTI